MSDLVVTVGQNANVIYDNTSDQIVIAGAPDQQTSLIIKGFVSTDIPDRLGEKIDPAAFDIEGFMRSGAILVNHELWWSEDGCVGSVGTCISLHEVVVKAGTGDNYSLVDVRANREIDVYPKARNPNITVGVRGLYAFIRLSNEDVIGMVTRGELRTFSWRGNSARNYIYDARTTTTYPSYSKIDIWEISLVSVACEPNASFVVNKDVFHSAWMQGTEKQAQSLASLLHLGDSVIAQGDKYCVCSERSVNTMKSVKTLQVFKGVELVLGEEPQQSILVTKDSLTSLQTALEQRGLSMSEKTPVTPEASAQAGTPASAPEVNTPANLDIVKSLTEALTPLMGTVTAVLGEVKATLAELVTKSTPAAVEPPKAETTPAVVADTAADVLKAALTEMQTKFTQDIATMSQALADVSKSVSAVVPKAATRTESGDSSGSNSDPNAHMSSIFRPLVKR